MLSPQRTPRFNGYRPRRWDTRAGRIGDVLERFSGHDSQPMLELEAYLLSIAVLAGRLDETAARAGSLEARTPDGSPLATAVQSTLAFRDLVAGESSGSDPDAKSRASAQDQRNTINGVSPWPSSPKTCCTPTRT